MKHTSRILILMSYNYYSPPCNLTHVIWLYTCTVYNCTPIVFPCQTTFVNKYKNTLDKKNTSEIFSINQSQLKLTSLSLIKFSFMKIRNVSAFLVLNLQEQLLLQQVLRVIKFVKDFPGKTNKHLKASKPKEVFLC